MIRNKYRGFTLIELLVVMGVVGILTVVLLSIINPLEQLAKTRDANRISAVVQLGKAMSLYVFGDNLPNFPVPTPSSNNWQSLYLAPKEIGSVITVPGTSSLCGIGSTGGWSVSSIEGNVCYYGGGQGYVGDGIVWTLLESKSNRQKAGCSVSGNDWPAAMWVSSCGKTGIVCLGWSGSGIPAPTPPWPCATMK